MKGDIVFLTHRLPFPPDRGDKIRSWNILKALALLAPVHVVALLDPMDKVVVDSPLHELAASLTLIPRTRTKAVAVAKALLSGQAASIEAFASPILQAAVDDLIQRHNVMTIYAYSGQMAQFVPVDRGGIRFVMDFVDMDSAKYDSYADQSSGISAFINKQESQRVFKFERTVAARADVSLFVSDAEAALFRQKTGLDRIMTLENGIDLDRYRPDHAAKASAPGQGPLIVFTGQMDYTPNVEAVVWFAEQVLPKLLEARFAIVGRAPTAKVQALADHARIIVTGEVTDPRDWIAAADIIVAPLLLARGIQNKILEAMAMGKAVIASPAAAEGIDATEMLVAADADEFAKSVRHLIANPNQAAALGSSARKRMEARYGWDGRMAGLRQLVMP